MAGYLGKISAIVTVNTSDIASKIQSGFAAPFEKSLRQIESTLRSTNSSILKSFDDIYTTGQKRARAMAAAQMGAVNGFDSEDFSKKLRVSEDAAKPLRAIGQEIEKVSGRVREFLVAELVEVQTETQAVADAFARQMPVAEEQVNSLIRRVEELGARVKAAQGNGWDRLSEMGRQQNAAFTRKQSGKDAMAAGFARLSEDYQARNAAAAQDAATQEQRLWAIRDADQRAFAERQSAIARAIHAEEQQAIAQERAARQEDLSAREAIREQVEQDFAERQRMTAQAIADEENAAIEAQARIRAAEEDRIQAAAREEQQARAAIREQIESDFQERQRTAAQAIADEEAAAIEAEARQRQAEEERIDAVARLRDAAMADQRRADSQAADAANLRMNQVANDRANGAAEFAGGFGGRGAAGVRLGIDRNALAGYTAELQILQRAIGRVAADARGPSVDAFDRLRAAISEAFESGQIGAVETQRNIRRLRDEAIRETSSAGGGNRRALTDQVGRAGDVARGGLDRFSLAVQQAGFAIDDFFSATGGLDMKIRAVSNNISQMAFVIGGTAGLFTGLAFTIGSQAVVALMKWADAGRTSTDRTQALNNAISEQQSLVKGLADAYKELAKSFSAAMSSPAQQDATRRRQFEDIAGKRKRANEELIYSSDAGVAAARASVVVAQNNASRATTVSQAKAAEIQLALARRMEGVAKEQALVGARRYNDFVGDGAAAGVSVQAGIQAAVQRLGQVQGMGLRGEERRQFEAQIAAQMAAVPAAANKEAAARQLREFVENELANNPLVAAMGNQGIAGMAGFAAEAGPIANTVSDVMEQLARLEFGLKESNAKIIDDVNRSLADTSDVIDKAAKSIDGAAMQTEATTNLRTQIDQVAASLEALSIAASETTDKDVLDAIAQDAAAARQLGDQLETAAKKAREFADELAKAIADEKAAADRGMELGKVRDEAAERANEIRAAAANFGNDAERKDFVGRAFGNVVADTQKVLQGFEQERMNAILGGPSRASLAASDVSTMEGQRELNRLLRGDDPNRDVNLAEMKHQSDLLQVIADRILAATGIAVDFR